MNFRDGGDDLFCRQNSKSGLPYVWVMDLPPHCSLITGKYTYFICTCLFKLWLSPPLSLSTSITLFHVKVFWVIFNLTPFKKNSTASPVTYICTRARSHASVCVCVCLSLSLSLSLSLHPHTHTHTYRYNMPNNNLMYVCVSICHHQCKCVLCDNARQYAFMIHDVLVHHGTGDLLNKLDYML